MYQAIVQLGQPDSTIFLQKYYMKRRNKDIAKGLQLTEKKVENILYYGKKAGELVTDYVVTDVDYQEKGGTNSHIMV